MCRFSYVAWKYQLRPQFTGTPSRQSHLEGTINCSGIRQTWVQIPTLLLASCGPLDNFLIFSLLTYKLIIITPSCSIVVKLKWNMCEVHRVTAGIQKLPNMLLLFIVVLIIGVLFNLAWGGEDWKQGLLGNFLSHILMDMEPGMGDPDNRPCSWVDKVCHVTSRRSCLDGLGCCGCHGLSLDSTQQVRNLEVLQLIICVHS